MFCVDELTEGPEELPHLVNKPKTEELVSSKKDQKTHENRHFLTPTEKIEDVTSILVFYVDELTKGLEKTVVSGR